MSSQVILSVGALVLCHAAYSCLHYRELLRDLQDAGFEAASAAPDEGAAAAAANGATMVMIPPADVWVEAAAGFLIILASELTRTGSSLRPVSSSRQGAAAGQTKMTPLAAPPYRTRNFDIYTTRAKAM